MAKRKIIEIDRDLCNGCGLCTTACAEGALRLDEEGKAVLVRELFCDGMGACLDVCPTDALKIIERDSETYNPQAAYQHVLKTRGQEAAENVHGIGDGGHHEGREHDHDYGHHQGPPGHGTAHGKGGLAVAAAATKRVPAMACGCPGTLAQEIKREPEASTDKAVSGRSELTQWPIQLHLVSPLSPYLQNADLLVAADCTAFSLGSFHQDLLKDKKLVIACPKLDETGNYVEKLAEIIKINAIRSLTVAIMTVPCCAGLYRMVEDAIELSGASLKPRRVVVGIDGKISG
ncbi:MAG: 4Fe-4S dicluster domain-containing protein [Candidatus Aminicenantes bacterium]|nr:4Fe-4S dicluster domain-containing protein [Candidatus Aminicenantes bacterium]